MGNRIWLDNYTLPKISRCTSQKSKSTHKNNISSKIISYSILEVIKRVIVPRIKLIEEHIFLPKVNFYQAKYSAGQRRENKAANDLVEAHRKSLILEQKIDKLRAVQALIVLTSINSQMPPRSCSNR